jgi:hypothetical protein
MEPISADQVRQRVQRFWNVLSRKAKAEFEAMYLPSADRICGRRAASRAGAIDGGAPCTRTHECVIVRGGENGTHRSATSRSRRGRFLLSFAFFDHPEHAEWAPLPCGNSVPSRDATLRERCGRPATNHSRTPELGRSGRSPRSGVSRVEPPTGTQPDSNKVPAFDQRRSQTYGLRQALGSASKLCAAGAAGSGWQSSHAAP